MDIENDAADDTDHADSADSDADSADSDADADVDRHRRNIKLMTSLTVLSSLDRIKRSDLFVCTTLSSSDLVLNVCPSLN